MTTLQDKFGTPRDEINAALIERDTEVSLIMTAMLSHEHCLFVGLPGTAKSQMCEAMADWLDGGLFNWQLNRFTKPEELFGPFDVMGMKKGEYRRITTGKLPEAHFAIIDEVFKGSSAILNTNLRIMNERKFDNGLVTVDCPLLFMLGTSNEYPTEAKELGALFDRFLIRKNVAHVAAHTNIKRLMFSPDLTPHLSSSLSLIELSDARDECQALPWSTEAEEAAFDIQQKLVREGITVGGRRLRKSIAVCRSHAWLNGSTEVTTDDLDILSHMWWLQPEGQPDVVADVVAEIARPSGLLAAQFLSEAQQIVNESDVSDLAEAAAASKKLQDTLKSCSKQCTGSRADTVVSRIEDMIRDIKMKTVESF